MRWKANASPPDLLSVFKANAVRVLTVDGGPEIHVQCPRCRRRGLKYKDFKLYIHSKTALAHCKRCDFTGNYGKLLQLFGYLRAPTTTTPSLEELRHELRGTRERDLHATESLPPREVIPAWRAAIARRYLASRGFDQPRAERYGFLYCTGGYFSGRLIAPVFDAGGRYRTFVARALSERCQRPERKYLYPKGCSVARLLYGLHSHQKAKRIRYGLLVEGLFDAIHLAPLGLGIFGSHVSDHQVTLLRTVGLQRVVLCFDHDATDRAVANIRASEERALHKLRPYFQVGVVHLPTPGTDPTDYPRRQVFKMADHSLGMR